MDDGISGYFLSVNGFASDSRLTVFTVDTNVLKGRQHRFKYRAKNAVGWGPFSEEAAILAARTPDIPSRPTFNSFSLDQLVIDVPYPDDFGGSAIELLELWVDEGDNFSSTFT